MFCPPYLLVRIKMVRSLGGQCDYLQLHQHHRPLLLCQLRSYGPEDPSVRPGRNSVPGSSSCGCRGLQPRLLSLHSSTQQNDKLRGVVQNVQITTWPKDPANTAPICSLPTHRLRYKRGHRNLQRDHAGEHGSVQLHQPTKQLRANTTAQSL